MRKRPSGRFLSLRAMLRRILYAILDTIYPESVPWQTEEDWERVLRQLTYTGEFAIEDNLTEDTVVWGGTRSKSGADSTVKRHKVDRRLVRGASFLWYEHNSIVQKLILRGKFGRGADPRVLECLTREAAYEMLNTDFMEGIDYIIPVPLHPRRLRERGFNQAEIIARVLSQMSGIPLDTTHLERHRYNKHQVGLRGDERSRNTQQLFTVNHPEELYHKHILLVDDVITTGSTIRACFEGLESTRDCRISVFALAKARKCVF